jgi:hypothetical protein
VGSSPTSGIAKTTGSAGVRDLAAPGALPKEWQLFGKLLGKSPQNAAADKGISR